MYFLLFFWVQSAVGFCRQLVVALIYELNSGTFSIYSEIVLVTMSWQLLSAFLPLFPLLDMDNGN